MVYFHFVTHNAFCTQWCCRTQPSRHLHLKTAMQQRFSHLICPALTSSICTLFNQISFQSFNVHSHTAVNAIILQIGLSRVRVRSNANYSCVAFLIQNNLQKYFVGSIISIFSCEFTRSGSQYKYHLSGGGQYSKCQVASDRLALICFWLCIRASVF